MIDHDVPEAIEEAAALCGPGCRMMVLTGAGCSTHSGIPDYRDENGEWKNARPVMYADFVGRASVRQRYWARSMLGWPRMADARPGPAHFAIARMQERGFVAQLVTQNVDGLHQEAGSRDVIDLHGRLDEVACLDCGARYPRRDWQSTIANLNPDWHTQVEAVRGAPDGDAIIEGADYGSFRVPECPACGGIVKPEVVFFGESVPRDRVDRAYAATDAADLLLVAGSSLMVFSGFRFVRRAHQAGKPIIIVNRGQTRADELASIKVDADVGEALTRFARRIG